MNLLERLGLARRALVRLLAAPADPVPGDPDAARALLRGEIRVGGETLVLRGVDWDMRGASEEFRSHVHGFHWLRDLALAAPQKEGAAFVQPVVAGWLAHFEEPEAEAWRADRAGARIAFWTLYAPYVLAGEDESYRKAVLGHLVAAAAHAERRFSAAPAGLPRIRAAAGILMCALLLDSGERRRAKAERRFAEAAASFVLPHGLPASRRPADLLLAMEWLHVLRAAYEARGLAWPEEQQAIDARARAGLRACRLGDGRLTAVAGGNIVSASRLEHALGWPGKEARDAGSGVDSGLQRLEAGRTALIMDAGPPPESDVNSRAYAGTLAFEMSDGPERLIVNVGGGHGVRRGIDRRLRTAVRLTAAHSTLVLDDTNQSEIEEDEPLGAGVETVAVERQEDERGTGISAAHDGYVRRFGFSHQRSLFLDTAGRDLRGEDLLVSTGRRRRRSDLEVAVRFHLAPSVDVTLTADSRGAVLRLPSGALWQLKVGAGTLSVDDSLWIGEEGRASRTRQLVIQDRTDDSGWTGRWSFKKVGEG